MNWIFLSMLSWLGVLNSCSLYNMLGKKHWERRTPIADDALFPHFFSGSSIGEDRSVRPTQIVPICFETLIVNGSIT